MERMNKGDLLHIGTAYVEVHTFKGKDYVAVRDFSTTTNALSKEILELEEENKKLKKELEQAIYWKVDYEKSYKQADAKRDELLEENKELKADLYHRDSFFSIMRDVLENEKLKFDFYELREILYCVVHEECGDYDLSEKDLEVVKKFWNREYV